MLTLEGLSELEKRRKAYAKSNKSKIDERRAKVPKRGGTKGHKPRRLSRK